MNGEGGVAVYHYCEGVVFGAGDLLISVIQMFCILFVQVLFAFIVIWVALEGGKGK